jgi:hypothetical protein
LAQYNNCEALKAMRLVKGKYDKNQVLYLINIMKLDMSKEG